MASEQQLMQIGDEFDASPPECLWRKTVKNLTDFQAVSLKIQRNLDGKEDFIGDYRSLADAFGMEQSDIRYLKSKSSPTDEVLNTYNPTLAVLYKHLSPEGKVNRSDVAKIIEDWVKENCRCEGCISRPIPVDLR